MNMSPTTPNAKMAATTAAAAFDNATALNGAPVSISGSMECGVVTI
jgi:hypothetical protein